MMRTSLFALFIFWAFNAFAGGDNPEIGGRSAGMANASVTLTDVWAVHNNQAGLAFITKPVAGIYYENRFMVSDLSLKSAAFALPVKKGVFGISMNYFGFSLYSESKIGLAYAMQFGEKLSAGIQLDYMNTRIAEGYGNKSVFAGEIGVRAKLTDALTLGAHLFNPSRPVLSSYNNEKTPAILRFGADYKFSKKVILAIETLKNIDQDPVFKAGLEYQIIEQIFLRAGMATNPSLNTFGIGVKLQNFSFDFASSFNTVLGVSPKVSMMYSF